MENSRLSFLINDENFTKVLVSTMIFYFYKTAFWPLTYIFIVCYISLLFSFFLRFEWKFRFADFIHDYYLPIILLVIFIVNFSLYESISNLIVQKDLLLIIILFSFFYLLYLNKNILFKYFSNSFAINLIVIITVSISTFNLCYQLVPHLIPPFLAAKLNISPGFTIANDSNFFCLFILFGLVILNLRSYNWVAVHNYSRFVIYFLNIIFIISIIYSGSRRGIIMLVLLLSIYFINYLTLSYKKLNFEKLLSRTIRFLTIVFLLIIFSIFLYHKMPKQKISFLLYRYATMIGVEDFTPIEKFLWKQDSSISQEKNVLIDKNSFKKGNTFWSDYSAPGTQLETVETPYGSGIKVLRDVGDFGGFSLYYVGPKILYYANHSYQISFKIKFLKGDFKSFNVGWWVDDGGNGYTYAANLNKDIEPLKNGWYNCTSQYTFIDTHIGSSGFINSVANQTIFIIADFKLIDLNSNTSLPRYVYEYTGNENINVFMKQFINTPNNLNLVNNGDFSQNLAFWRFSADSVSIKIVNLDGKNCALISRRDGDGGYWSLYYGGRNIEFWAMNEYQLSFKIKLVFPKTVPINVGFWVNEGNGPQIALKQEIDSLSDGWMEVRAKYTFKNNQSNLLFPLNSQIDNSQFYITDIRLKNITQTQYLKKQVDESSFKINEESRFSDRTSRWYYALTLWQTKYKWYHKLFGHGFDYLKWYGEKFLGNSKFYDWPHNPFISILLYSGILGLCFYVFILGRVVLIYIKYRKKYRIAFIGFLITFFFSFFSAGSPFDPPIMGFFMLLPFFIHSIHKNDAPKLTTTLTDAKNSDYRYK
jgi:hypothetical protein